jgi:hypothetical protein
MHFFTGETPQHQSSELNDFLSTNDDFFLPQLGFQPRSQRAPELRFETVVITSTTAILSRSVSLPSRHSP